MTAAPWHRGPAAAAATFLIASLALVLLRPLLPVDETRYLAVAWEMWNGGSKIVPHLNGEIYSHKPPLLFWIINLVWSVTGVTELGGRLVGPVAGAAAVLLTARLARELWPEAPERAGRAAWVLATTGVFLAYGSATMFDTLLTLATLTALLAIWSLARRTSVTAILWLGAGLAFGVLAKGPVILIHVLPVAVALPLWRGSQPGVPGAAFARAFGLAVLVALALVALWLVPALIFGDPAYRSDILWRQSAGRMITSFAHDRPFWFFLALMPVFLWPWGWRWPAPGTLRRRWSPQARFLAVWAGGALLAVSLISGKQIHYLVPELPALALLLSGTAATVPARWFRLVPLAPAMLLLAAGALAATGLLSPALLGGTTVGAVELALAGVVTGTALVIVWTARSSLAAIAVVAPATLLVVHLLAFQTLWQANNPNHLAPLLAAHATAGVATTDTNHAGQFSFSARLTVPVRILRDPAALSGWTATRPGSLVLSKTKLDGPAFALLREVDLHGDRWFAYRVATGS